MVVEVVSEMKGESIFRCYSLPDISTNKLCLPGSFVS